MLSSGYHCLNFIKFPVEMVLNLRMDCIEWEIVFMCFLFISNHIRILCQWVTKLVDSYWGRFFDRRDDINYLQKLYSCPSFKTFIMLPFKTFIVEKLILDVAIWEEKLIVTSALLFFFWWEQSNMGLGRFIPLHWQHEKRSWCYLPSSKKNNIHFTKPGCFSNSMQVWCTPIQCWHACRSHKWGPGLYMDIGLGTSVSFCTRFLYV